MDRNDPTFSSNSCQVTKDRIKVIKLKIMINLYEKLRFFNSSMQEYGGSAVTVQSHSSHVSLASIECTIENTNVI